MVELTHGHEMATEMYENSRAVGLTVLTGQPLVLVFSTVMEPRGCTEHRDGVTSSFTITEEAAFLEVKNAAGETLATAFGFGRDDVDEEERRRSARARALSHVVKTLTRGFMSGPPCESEGGVR